ncbi:MAG: hypothetical protein JNJ59_07515 [Deltaproteobacteria bacterium]|nr:hypothetical protein [Deltaproteobacteria bacterium]
MTHGHFARYVLRTLDADAARAFYDAVLGHHGHVVFPLHEQAIARGARPHWLGHIDVADPRAAAAPLLAAGGFQYGERPDGVVVLRDPGGALIALGGASGPSSTGASTGRDASGADVVWHVLRAQGADAVAALYAKTLGWVVGETVTPIGDASYRSLAAAAGEPSFGVVGETTAGVHPQWLFFFGVPSLDAAVEQVRALGGRVLEPSVTPEGTRYAVCDDPQGAAFGLIER